MRNLKTSRSIAPALLVAFGMAGAGPAMAEKNWKEDQGSNAPKKEQSADQYGGQGTSGQPQPGADRQGGDAGYGKEAEGRQQQKQQQSAGESGSW
ncbi:hypothetical protein [Spectribacter hydrogenoxidans]|uniref:Uncharacterized protein n=1 Tax=Spectribacter hydrogenoxidans TaxID=3075608 RepID=A0ABU3BWR3_9GAMM|nr:hypothetical protein [Salinisphaera sp. W335]MDT0633738.1 hypothetical protein [Salinisphaera sp. W335]